jgi:diguanylate cyclase (GGDEF)-like protein
MLIGGIIAAIAGYLIEKSKRKLFLSKLESDEFKYLIDNSHEFIAIYEIETHKYLYVNKAIVKRCNCTKELILKKSITDIHPELTKDIVSSMFESLEHNDKIEDVISLKDGNGKEYYSHTTLQYGHFKSKKVIIDFSNDVTEQKNAELKIEEMAKRDSLTQLYNRYKFDEYILSQISDYKGQKKSFSFVICDIDFFKKINDTYGHLVGDKVLKNIANVIQNCVRKSDVVARWGGEEFAILLPNTSLSEATKITTKIHKAVSTYVHEEVGNVYISCGVSTFEEGDTQSTIFNRVDTALYEAKNSGRNKICIK